MSVTRVDGAIASLDALPAIADAVESLSDETAELTDAELRAKTDEFRERYEDGESLDSLLPEAFAVVREAASRTLGQFHYPVQVMGGAGHGLDVCDGGRVREHRQIRAGEEDASGAGQGDGCQGEGWGSDGQSTCGLSPR